MRKLTPEEERIWNRVVETLTPIGCHGKPKVAPRQVITTKPSRPSRPSRTIDLHGLSVMDAFLEVRSFIEDSMLDNARSVTIITGKSGLIRAEFIQWLENLPVSKYELLNNGGAFKIFLKKLR
jgi:dsDNA-specific endonuclease/ATPase MutS2